MQSTCACFHETTRGIKQFHIHGMDLEFLKKTARIHYQEKETNCKNKLLTHMKARIKKKMQNTARETFRFAILLVGQLQHPWRFFLGSGVTETEEEKGLGWVFDGSIFKKEKKKR